MYTANKIPVQIFYIGNLSWINAVFNQLCFFKIKCWFIFGIISIELGIRFLEDYLKGDCYFKVNYPEHNLDRARTQLNLAVSIIENIDVYKKITDEVIKGQ